MNKLIPISILAAAIVSVAFAHEGHEHATGVVRERMELMTGMGQRMLAANAFAPTKIWEALRMMLAQSMT